MAIRKVAVPYAKALLDVAVDQGVLSKVRGELTDFAWSVRRSEDLRVIITNPTIASKDRRAVVNAVASQMHMTQLTRNFLNLLVDKGRINFIVDIAELFRSLADKKAGIVRAEVESAVALTLEQQTQLKSALELRTKKRVLLDARVNPELIAGVRVRVEGRLYDGSVKRHFENLRDAILQDL